MKIQTIIYPLCMAALLGSCHIYKPYSRPEVDTQGLYRDPVSVNDTLVSDTVNMANLPWEKVFTDPQLQVLIRLGLERNTDLQTAMLQVKEAQASLMTSRLSYLPSLTLAPQGGVSSFDRMKGSWSWSLPVSASWELDLFGKILNTKRAAKAALLRSEAYRQAVQTQVVAAIANYYYTLLMLDKQLQITEETAVLWGENVETMKAMKEAAMVNEAGVVQSEANYYMVLASISDLKNQIRETENALSLLLRQAPQKIERGKLEDQQLPTILHTGVPVVCCGEKMTELIPGTSDGAHEKHVPAFEVNGNKVSVKVGSVEHPMMEKHYIQWILIETNFGTHCRSLTPEDKPEAEFFLADGEKLIAVYEYCNLHGLWKAEA